MNPIVLGFNLCLLAMALLWLAARLIARRGPKPSRLSRSILGALWELRFMALLMLFGVWLSFRTADNPKPEAYYGNPNWWAEVEASDTGEWKHRQPSQTAEFTTSDVEVVPASSLRVTLPDLKLTPGLADPALTTSRLCARGFRTTRVRAVDETTKRKVCIEYGIPPSRCTGATLEIDHLISLELGGSNDIRNLWPQPYLPKPGAREKDLVENWLHRQVCSGQISLGEAQREISQDWYSLYLRMPKKSLHPRQQ